MFGSVKVRSTKLSRRARLSRWSRESPVTFWVSAVFVGLLMAAIPVSMLPGEWFGIDGTASLPSAGTTQDGTRTTKCAEQAPSSDDTGLLVPGWTLVGTTPVPQSPTGGPVLANTPRQCFTHSPEGAVYAAASTMAELLTVSDPEQRQLVLTERISHTGNFAKMMAASGRKFVPPTTKIEFVGYLITGVDPDAVNLDLAVRPINGNSAGIVSAMSFSMVWENNDWLMLAPAASNAPSRSLTDFTGFTPWGQAG